MMGNLEDLNLSVLLQADEAEDADALQNNHVDVHESHSWSNTSVHTQLRSYNDKSTEEEMNDGAQIKYRSSHIDHILDILGVPPLLVSDRCQSAGTSLQQVTLFIKLAELYMRLTSGCLCLFR